LPGLQLVNAAEAIGKFRESLARQQHEGINRKNYGLLGDDWDTRLRSVGQLPNPMGAITWFFGGCPPRSRCVRRRSDGRNRKSTAWDLPTLRQYSRPVALRDQLVKQLLDYCQPKPRYRCPPLRRWSWSMRFPQQKKVISTWRNCRRPVSLPVNRLRP